MNFISRDKDIEHKAVASMLRQEDAETQAIYEWVLAAHENEAD